jgi:hypothetical protein
MLRLINLIVKIIRLENIEDELYNSILKEFIIPFDDLIKVYYRPPFDASKRKSKKSSSEMRKPELPRASPLFLDQEMCIIHKLSKPIFKNLDDIKSNYINKIQTESFANVKKTIAETYNRRWKVLSTFSAITTKRLQEVRKSHPEIVVKRKVDVNHEMITKTISSRQNPTNQAIEEISVILPIKDIHDVILAEIYHVDIAKEETLSAIDLIRHDVSMCYFTSKICIEKPESINRNSMIEREVKMRVGSYTKEYVLYTSEFTNLLRLSGKLSENRIISSDVNTVTQMVSKLGLVELTLKKFISRPAIERASIGIIFYNDPDLLGMIRGSFSFSLNKSRKWCETIIKGYSQTSGNIKGYSVIQTRTLVQKCESYCRVFDSIYDSLNRSDNYASA